MGQHYEGCEEKIRQEEEIRRQVLNSLTTEQLVKAKILDSNESLHEQLTKIKSQIKANNKALSRLGKVKVPRSVELVRRYWDDFNYKFKYGSAAQKLLQEIFK